MGETVIGPANDSTLGKIAGTLCFLQAVLVGLVFIESVVIISTKDGVFR